ncbi:MAG TPA: hypothetical protein DEQ03_15955 [Marinilabiliales bacterium]|nr:hypothetical protein [Marinilabiliales bacterium]
MRKMLPIKMLIGAGICLMASFGNLSAQWTHAAIDGGYIRTMINSGDTLYAVTQLYGNGLFFSTDVGTTWNEILSESLPTSKRVIAKFGSSLFLGCGSVREAEGIYRSDDNGVTWVKKNSNPMWVTCFAQHGSTIFAGTGEGLLRSTDNGETWKYIYNGLAESKPHIYSLLVTESGIFTCIGNNYGIYRSTDNGNTWVQTSTGMQIDYYEGRYYYPTVTALSYIGDAIYAGCDESGIFKSTNGGDNWSLTSEGTYDYYSIQSIVGKDSLLYAATIYNGVIRSTDAGNNWTEVNGNGIDIWLESNALVMHNNDVLVGTKGGIYKSADHGINWTKSDSGIRGFWSSYPPVITLDSDLYAGTMTGGIYKSSDNGTSWAPANEGFPVNDVNMLRYLSANATTLFAKSISSYYSTISTDGGNSWHETVQDSIFPWIDHKGKLYTYGPNSGVYRSDDDGITWTLIENSQYFYLSLHSDGETLFLGTYLGYFYSTDNGTTWQQSNVEGVTGYICAYQFISTPTAKIMSLEYAGRRGIFRSTDNGANWVQTSNVLVTELVNDGSNLYANATERQIVNGQEVEVRSIYQSKNDGVTWKNISGSLGNNIAWWGICAIDGKIFVPLNSYPDYGLYCSSDNGATWKEISLGMIPGNQVFNLSAVDNYIYAGTGNGLYRRDLAELYPPSQTSTIAGKTDPCIKSTQTYTVEPVNGISYEWQIPSDWAILSGQTTNTITVMVGSGSGYVSVIPSNEFGTGPTQIVAVAPNGNAPAKPDAITGSVTPTANTTENYSVTSVAGITYEWSLPGDWTMVSGNGTHEITVTVGNLSGDITCTPLSDCGPGEAQTLAVAVKPLGIGQQSSQKDITIYPNPVTDEVTIDIKNLGKNVVTQIIDIRGNLIRQSKGQSSDGHYYESFDLSNYARGVYYIHVWSNQKSYIEKIVIQ